MKCADARHLIHLSVGDDTLTPEEQSLSEHLHECSDCRAYHAGTLDAMTAVHVLRDNATIDRQPSIWPSVQRAIQAGQIRPRQPQRQFSGAVAALCACSLVLALTTIVRNLPATSPDPYNWPGTTGVNWTPPNVIPGTQGGQMFRFDPNQGPFLNGGTFLRPDGQPIQRMQPVQGEGFPALRNPQPTF